MNCSFCIDYVITFYIIITPIAILSKIFGKDFLDLKKQAFNDSYWNLRTDENVNIKNHEKQCDKRSIFVNEMYFTI